MTFRPDPAGRPRSAARLWAFRLVSALLAPALLLAAVEGGLRLAGVGHPSAFTVPCTVQGRPASCGNDRFTWQFFPPGAFRLPSSFAIPAEKAPGTFRIFVLGESAAMGDPEPAYAFSRYLEVMLRERFPGIRFEVVNAGITAINSHVVLPIARDLASKQPDLFVVYAGNNEVVGPYGAGTVLTPQGSSLGLIRAGIAVKSTRLGGLAAEALRRKAPGASSTEWRGMEMFLQQQVPADAPGLARVYDHFEANLRDVVKVARGSGARVLVSTIATNLKDCAPFASPHRAGLAPDALARFDALYRAGRTLEGEGRWADAARSYLAAEAIDDRYADLQFRLGTCAASQGDFAAARARFVRARDLDALRFRADSRIEEIVRSAAASAGPGVELVDGEAALAEASPHGIPGREVLYEHVHLTPHGNYLLARAMFPRIAALLPGPARPGASAPPSEDECDLRLALTPADRSRVARDVLGRLARPPFTNQLDHDAQVRALRAEADAPAGSPGETAAAYRWAIARTPDDPGLRSRLGAVLLASDPAAAAAELRVALELLPNDYDAREKLAEALVKLGRLPEAIAECRALVERMPFYPSPHLTLAYALARTGALDESVASYERAVHLAPSLATQAYEEIGRIRVHQERFDLAAAAFQSAIDRDSDRARTADLLFDLGHALRKAGRGADANAALGRAVAAYRSDLVRHPESAPARFGLASALVESGDLPGAAEQFRAAARLDPRDVEAHLGLVRALEVQGRLDDAIAAAREGAAALAAAGQGGDASVLEQRAAAIEARRRM